MALLLVVALLSATGTLVGSASNKTACDSMSAYNDTCFQVGCNQLQCSFLCGLSSPFEFCQQKCSGNCSTLVCSSLIQNCQQQCPGSFCKAIMCDSKRCYQSCNGRHCEVMRCSNWNKDTTCYQKLGREMICDSESCGQSCTGGRCNMTCSSRVKRCWQSCRDGECVYQCDANQCSMDCARGICTKIKSATTTKSTPKSTTKPSGGSGTHLQMGISLVLVSMFTLLVFI